MPLSHIDELLMMTSDEIDFGTLSEEILVQIALSDDPFIATESLGELQYRQSNLTKEVAKKILISVKGDAYLKAAAFETLLKLDVASSLDYVRENAKKCPPYLFNAMVEALLDNAESLALERLDPRTLKAFLERAEGSVEDLNRKALAELETKYSLYST
ncbi:MAG: hypothetical protein WA885_24695 [Phormidesmis sp.]